MKLERCESLDERIVVRIARISQAHEALPLLESWLTPGERERAARFHFAEDRARFILGRGLLRKSLSPHLEQAPETIQFSLTDRDRPTLPDNETLQFSLSHSHDLVAVALTSHARIGIDVEWMQNKSDLTELAKRILSEADFQAFQALPENEKVVAFFRIWTRKEAFLKATGEGITEALQQISVTFGPEIVSTVVDHRAQAEAGLWTLFTLPVPSDYMGSVACDNAKKEVTYELVHFDQGEIISDSTSDLS
jgi:4'-phosphopantetheinyl transferase